MAPSETMRLLPKELMELQVGQIDLLIAMYASDNAISLDDASGHLLESLKEWCEGSEDASPAISGQSILLVLTLDLSDGDGGSRGVGLDLEISVLLVYDGQDTEAPSEPPKARIRVRQPPWMNKAETSRLTDGIPDEDILSAIEYVREEASRLAQETSQTDVRSCTESSSGPFTRTWFYFPSISTRSKRDDIVNYAPAYGLTGFLLAGKPGLLCLEGLPDSIDEYMRFIKTESWSDIPSQHKKVSERLRESGPDLKRAFQDMQEITDLVGERRGVRANRNDMKALEAWLHKHGVGAAFERVLI